MEKLIPSYNKIHPEFKFNSVHYAFNDLNSLIQELLSSEEVFEKRIASFLLEWIDSSETIVVNTSGSTGVPKPLKIKKEAMINSALATGNFFNLQPKDKVLLCLPANYIAGKMMLVRAMVLGLEMDTINPSSNLIINKNKFYRFCAMVPLQLQNGINFINNFDTIILGGTAVSAALKAQLQEVSCNLFETYGMTETITHIAIKKLNNFNPYEIEFGAYFEILPNIEIYQDHRDCLVIDAPLISEDVIITNDIVKLHSKTEFEWLGRIDNVINTGGVKVFPEQIEKKLQKIFKQRFFISSIKDEFLGEKVILIVEGKYFEIEQEILELLDKFEKPKEILFTENFLETNSGKLHRSRTLASVLNEKES